MRQISFLALIAAVFSFALSGCERPEDPMLKVLQANSNTTRVDDLSRTIDFLFSERQFDLSEFENRVSLGLNRWANYSDEKFAQSDWKEDASITPMLSDYADLPVVQRMSESSFLATDATYLQAAVWCQQIANRVDSDSTLAQFELYRLMADDFEAEDDETSPLNRVVEKLHPSLEPEQAKRLASAIKLFDWVTRNIQLVEPVEYDAENLEESQLVSAETPSASGISEPGGRKGPWEVLVFARGDYIEKAKLFSLLCQQLDINTVMLATSDGDSETPWAVGVEVADQLYVFDTRLGLPIFSENVGSVATISELKNDESLLESLDLTVEESLADDTDYWVKSSDLKSLVGLIYWSPESVSRRMAVLEESLIGDQRLVLTRRADELASTLPQIEGLTYIPWDIALKTQQFRKVLRESLPKAVTDDALAQKLNWYPAEEDYVNRFPIYRTSRTRFFRGKFERPRGKRSRDAIESFGILMYDDATINNLASDRDLQAQIGIRKDGRSPDEFDRDIQSRQAIMRLVRRDAGFFMCQAHFDNGSVSTTATWLPQLIEESDTERWQAGLSYLYSRALEARHQYDEAIETLDVAGPQQHGNLIRARLLKEQIETVFADKRSSDAESKNDNETEQQ